jgi:hypothetical protein
MNYETVAELELVAIEYFWNRTSTYVPNLHCGDFPFEMDIAWMTAKGYMSEIEIKIDKSDVYRDKTKEKWKRYPKHLIRETWFVIPGKLIPVVGHIPEFAGIIVVDEEGYANEFRKAHVNKCHKMTRALQLKVAKLGAARLWNLKQTIFDLKEE